MALTKEFRTWKKTHPEERYEHWDARSKKMAIQLWVAFERRNPKSRKEAIASAQKMFPGVSWETAWELRVMYMNGYHHTYAEDVYYIQKLYPAAWLIIEAEWKQKMKDEPTAEEIKRMLEHAKEMREFHKQRMAKAAALKALDPYVILGIKHSDTPEEVKTRYRVLVKANHPDCGGNTDTMAKINVAYERYQNELQEAI